MNEREWRFVRSLRTILLTIQQDVSSVHNQQKADEEDRDKPHEVNLVRAELQLPEGTERQNQTNADRSHTVQVWLCVGTWLAFVAAAIYAGLSRYELQEIKKQTTIAEASNRPWIKIVDVSLTHLPDFPTLRFTPIPGINPAIMGTSLQTTITVKNIGKGVAQGVFIAPILRYYKWNSPVSIDEEQRKECGQAGIWNPGAPFVWSAVFPDETRVSPITTMGRYSNDMYFHPTDRSGDWISGTLFVCVSYQSPRPYNTSVTFPLMGEHDRFVEVGKPMNDPQISLRRDQHSEYAQ